MRNPRIVIGLSIAAFVLAAAFSQASPVAVSVSVFHDQLAPHGRWVAAASYGDVWAPSGVSAGWQPYVEGEWVYSDYGWTWVSDDPWGDVPYHYGTWAWVEPHGWVWIPGTVWAPAWVTWAYTDDYVGWAPVPPSFVLSANGYFGAPVVVVATRYVFVPAPRFVGVRVSTVRVAPQQNVTIFTRATKTTRFQVSNGIVRTAGPSPQRIEKAVGHPVERVPISRIRTQPTTLAAAGETKSKSIRVVAPERERKAEAPKGAEKKESKKEQAAPARESSAQGHIKPETASAPRATSQGHAKPERAAASSEPSKKTVASEKPVHHGDTAAERPKAAAQKPEKHQSAEREKATAAKPLSEPKAQSEAAPPHDSSAEQKPPKPAPAKKAANKPPPKEKEPPADHPHD